MTRYESLWFDLKNARGLADRDLRAVETALVEALDGIPEIVVQKVRRLPHSDPNLDLSVLWTGAGASAREVQKALEAALPRALFPPRYEIERETERDRVEIKFLGVTEEGRALRGRIVGIL